MKKSIKSAKSVAPAVTPERPALPSIDLALRTQRRSLSTADVLTLLEQHAPQFFPLAQVVGQWVWVQFQDKQPREVTSSLAVLGFHWNNKRQAWQHPCGHLAEGTESDPRRKYRAYFPAAVRASA